MTVYAPIKKMLWRKCKSLRKKLIHLFCVTNGCTRLRTVENGGTYVNTHLSNLGEIFPGNELLSNKV